MKKAIDKPKGFGILRVSAETDERQNQPNIMKTYTVYTSSPRHRDLYHFQGKNAKRDATRYLARYIRETGDNQARISTYTPAPSKLP